MHRSAEALSGGRRSPCRAPQRVAYVLKRYPRFSETFVVNEILAHEAAGLSLEIFALRPTTDSHFQHAIANVRAPVTYLRYSGIKAETFWEELTRSTVDLPAVWSHLARARGYTAIEVYQAVQLAQQIRARRIDHMHAHFATSAAAVARLASLMTGVPYTITAHAKDIFHHSVDEQMLADKIHDAAAVVTVSDFNLQNLQQRFPESAARLHRIYNGLQLEDYPLDRSINPQPVVLAVGRLVEKKGFRHLVDACAALRDRNCQFECQIVGGGELADALQQQIDAQHLGEHVRLLGPRPLAEVRQRMRQAALLVVPCITATTGDRDGLPTVLLEAMACGTPCLSTELVGIPEVVRHLETGLLVPEQDTPALADGIRQLLHDRSLGQRLATAARELIECQFDVQRNSAELRQLFTQQAASANLPSLAEVG
jgi:glycosyltransferase involved in cell wall biosynthesis